MPQDKPLSEEEVLEKIFPQAALQTFVEFGFIGNRRTIILDYAYDFGNFLEILKDFFEQEVTARHAQLKILELMRGEFEKGSDIDEILGLLDHLPYALSSDDLTIENRPYFEFLTLELIMVMKQEGRDLNVVKALNKAQLNLLAFSYAEKRHELAILKLIVNMKYYGFDKVQDFIENTLIKILVPLKNNDILLAEKILDVILKGLRQTSYDINTPLIKEAERLSQALSHLDSSYRHLFALTYYSLCAVSTKHSDSYQVSNFIKCATKLIVDHRDNNLELCVLLQGIGDYGGRDLRKEIYGDSIKWGRDEGGSGSDSDW